jgi:hypothetical protein
MAVNDADFDDGKMAPEVWSGALGYKGTHRGGGIINPQVHVLPVKTVLLRLYKKPLPGDEYPGDYGPWWFTPFEYKSACAHLGVDGRALIVGRAGGKSALHGIFATLSEWYDGSPHQLACVNAVELTQPFRACYGHGAPANSLGYVATEKLKGTMKPMLLAGNKSARQLYLHRCFDYKHAMKPLLKADTSTDTAFGSKGGLPREIANAPRLAFEV